MNQSNKDFQNKIDKVINEINSLPATDEKPPTIFEIAGISRRENINSNILQFYLNKENNHGFGSLFFDSLCSLIKDEEIGSLLDSDFEVFREYKNIDLLIVGKSSSEEETKEEFEWAIIIEHKIHHTLDNDLRAYWKSVNVKKNGFKKGIVLSPWGQNDNKALEVYEKKKKDAVDSPELITKYQDLNHREWMGVVKGKISDYYLQSNNYHLLILKDFLNNIESMYMSKLERQKRDEQINIYLKNEEEIKDILNLDHSVKQYILEETINVMAEFGFKPNSAYFSKTGKHFFKDRKGLPDYFRFYFWFPSVYEKGTLFVFFELQKEYVRFGDEMHQQEDFKKIESQYSDISISKENNNVYYQLLKFQNTSFKDFNEKKTFPDHLREVMNEVFFQKKTGLLHQCKTILERILNDKSEDKAE